MCSLASKRNATTLYRWNDQLGLTYVLYRVWYHTASAGNISYFENDSGDRRRDIDRTYAHIRLMAMIADLISASESALQWQDFQK